MDPWKPENPDAKHEVPFHALRLALFAAGVAAWLLRAGRPGIAVPVGLALALALDLWAHLGPRGARAAWTACAAGLAGLLAVRWAGDVALVGVPMAVALGAPRVLPELWAVPWTVVYTGIGLVAAAPHDPAAALYAAGGLLLAGWFGLQYADQLRERERYRQALTALEEAHARLEELAANARDLAAERERQRVLGAVHDTLGHALTANLLQVQVARRLLARDPAAAEARLATVEEALREALTQVRQVLRRSLHPAQLPLASALELLAEDFTAAGGPEVSLEFQPDAVGVSDVDEEVAEVLYRAVQEALTNAVRHGRARRVRVRLAAAGQRLLLTVRDDGAGTADFVPGMGLSGMTARVQAVGGSIRFRTAPGEGFEVEIGVRRR